MLLVLIQSFNRLLNSPFLLPHPCQLRRQSRERREYIYRKSLEAKETQIWERKQRIRQLLAEGKPIPAELKADATADGMARELRMDEGQDGE